MRERVYRTDEERVREEITAFVRDFVRAYESRKEISTRWGEPLVGFADAWDPYIQDLRRIISPTHALPQDILAGARIVLVYYVPFTRELARTNQTGTLYSSPDWALAYEETNAMFGVLNGELVRWLSERGYTGVVAPQSATFDQKRLISDWSHRHFAYAAGLGTFGLNNMLLTPLGCCGRYSSLVTDLDVRPGHRRERELCLYKDNGSCGICVRHCPGGALTVNGYDRQACYQVLRKNAEVYTMFGSSYTDETGTSPNSVGSEVCGKCVTASPCAFWNRKE